MLQILRFHNFLVSFFRSCQADKRLNVSVNTDEECSPWVTSVVVKLCKGLGLLAEQRQHLRSSETIGQWRNGSRQHLVNALLRAEYRGAGIRFYPYVSASRLFCPPRNHISISLVFNFCIH